jgi:hypothetical protein
MAAFSEHANHAAVLSEFSAVASDVATYQATYLSTNKRYWQGLLSHTLQTLDDGTQAFTSSPVAGGETEGWDQVSTENVRASYECDAYNGGGDHPGYILRAKIKHDSGGGEETYQKEQWYGPRSDSEFSNFTAIQSET